MNRINVYQYPECESPVLAGWFDLDKVAEAVKERTEWDGHNTVSAQPIGRYEHQVLYRTAKGRWVLHTWSQYDGVMPTYVFIDDDRAKVWLTVNESDDVIERYFGELEEEAGPGRPTTVGGKPVPIMLGDLIGPVDDRAAEAGVSRAEMVRQLIAQALALT